MSVFYFRHKEGEMVKRIFIIGLVILWTSISYAAVAGDTSDPKIPYGPGIAGLQASGFGPLKVSFDADWIFKKDLEGENNTSNPEFEGQWYLFRLGYNFFDRIEPYAKIGFSHLKTRWTENSKTIKVEGENALAVGVGGKVLAFEIPEHRIRFSIDGQYLYTDPGVEKAYVDNPTPNISAGEFKIAEWQIAGIVSMEFPLSYDKHDTSAVYSLIPYLGVAFFNSDIKANFTNSGVTRYDLGTAENSDKLLLITGCDVVSPQNISLNVEGRWIGESAVSGGLTAKF
jgi:hypothetical protein